MKVPGAFKIQSLINLFKHDMEFTKTENQQDIADEAMPF